LPGAPTGVTATPGDGQATVSWSAPASNGGSAIDHYTVTAAPGGASTQVPGSQTTGVVTNLANGVAYTFTVTATNATGTSPASTPSSSVTPVVAPPPPPPVIPPVIPPVTPPVPPPPPAVRRPDAMIKAAGPTYAGGNVYNTTAASQTVKAKVHPSKAKTFTVGLQNDGNAPDAFRIKGTGSSKGFRVSYFVGSTNVTSAVVAGSFVTSALAPGATTTLIVKIKASKKAPIGTAKSVTLTDSSSSDPAVKDAVRAKVKVVA
jgi:Fibronectin type III domain